VFIHALEIIATIFLMIGIGFFLAWRGYLDEPGKRLVSLLVVRVALPGTILRSLLTQFDRAALFQSGKPLLVAFITILLCWLAALLFTRFFRIPANRVGVFLCMVTFSNSVFIGFPINRALLGEAGIPSATLYYLANTILFWTVGTALIRKDGLRNGTSAGSGKWIDGLKNLLNPPLITLALTVVMILLNIQLPAFLLNTADYIGNLVTPLSMIFIGAMLCDVFRRGIRWERGFGALLGMRFLLSPAIAIALCVLLNIDTLTRQSFLLQSGMSVMTQVAITSHAYHADSEYASLGVALSTCCLLLVLPVFALLIPRL
jgi:predicted permease